MDFVSPDRLYSEADSRKPRKDYSLRSRSIPRERPIYPTMT